MKKQNMLIQNTSQFLIFLVSYLIVFSMLVQRSLIEKDTFPLILTTGAYFLISLFSLLHPDKKHYQTWATIFLGISFGLAILLTQLVQ